MTVILIDGSALTLLSADRYRVVRGGLVVTSRKGNVMEVPAGRWFAVGTLAHDPELGYHVAIKFYSTPPQDGRMGSVRIDEKGCS
jgi:hypothetical protein